MNNRAKATECKLIKYIGYDVGKRLSAINTFYIADNGKLYVTFGISNSRLNNVLDLNDEKDLDLYNTYKVVVDQISEYEAKSEKMNCENPRFTGELNGEDLKAYYTGMDNVVDIDIFDNAFATKEVMITTKDGKHYTLDPTVNTTGEIKFNEVKYDGKNIIKVEDLLVGDSLYTRYIDISGNYVK